MDRNSIKYINIIRNIAEATFSKAYKERDRISLSEFEDVMQDFEWCESKILALNPIDLQEAMIKLNIAVIHLGLERGETLADQDDMAADQVRAVQAAVSDVVKFCRTPGWVSAGAEVSKFDVAA